MRLNPYEPPFDYEAPRQLGVAPKGDLAKASRYLSRMGALAIAYFCATGIGSAIACVRDDQLNTVIKLLLIAVPTVMIPLTVSLTRAASRISNDPIRHLRKARWLGILLGTFFFPFLTWPAYVAIRNMTQYSKSIRG